MSIKNSWDETFLQIAQLIGERHSTCERIKIGALIVKDGRIISIGYNGVAPKVNPECHEFMWNYFIEKYKTTDKEAYEKWKKTNEFKIVHRKFSIENELHAEFNAISFALKNGININNSTLYVVYSPCINCAKVITATGISKVIYLHYYRPDDDGLIILKKHNIQTLQFILKNS